MSRRVTNPVKSYTNKYYIYIHFIIGGFCYVCFNCCRTLKALLHYNIMYSISHICNIVINMLANRLSCNKALTLDEYYVILFIIKFVLFHPLVFEKFHLCFFFVCVSYII